MSYVDLDYRVTTKPNRQP